MFIAASDAAIASGDFTGARQNLDKARKQIHASGAKNANLDYSYAQLYDKMAARTQARRRSSSYCSRQERLIGGSRTPARAGTCKARPIA